MAADGPRSGGQNGGHPAPVAREATVADGVDAEMDRMQAAELQPVDDCVMGNTCIEELPPADNAVLLFRMGRNEPIHPAELGSGGHIRLDPRSVGHGRQVGRQSRATLRRM
jgi:hypothetical protein